MTHNQEDFALFAIFIILLTAAMLVYHNEIWAFMDWIMETTENFYGRHG